VLHCGELVHCPQHQVSASKHAELALGGQPPAIGCTQRCSKQAPERHSPSVVQAWPFAALHCPSLQPVVVQTFPQTPQWLGLLSTFVSQPGELASQSPNPGTQIAVQVPAEQTGVAFGATPHAVPHVPQLERSVCRFTQAPAQSVKSGLHTVAQAPVPGSQEAEPLATAGQVTGVPAHRPRASHSSSVVQASPSSQAAPALIPISQTPSLVQTAEAQGPPCSGCGQSPAEAGRAIVVLATDLARRTTRSRLCIDERRETKGGSRDGDP
jgi:hypothetical protein